MPVYLDSMKARWLMLLKFDILMARNSKDYEISQFSK